jgi:hypothetical protein
VTEPKEIFSFLKKEGSLLDSAHRVKPLNGACSHQLLSEVSSGDFPRLNPGAKS